MNPGPSTETIQVDRRRLTISNPDKVLFDDPRLTKQELVEHYRRVAPVLVPHIRRRPLSVQRFPDGIGAGGFMQKQRPDHAPDWIAGVEVPRVRGGSITMVTCDDAVTLAWLADQATITVHPWLSRADALDRPDRIIFDLDPPGDDFDQVREAAVALHELLDELRLPGYLMTTGSRGLHVVVPIRPEQSFDDTRDFARDVADTLAARHPDRLTTQVRKDRRGERLFLDILRNAYAQHAVAPYAVRPLPGAPVATPLRWSELDATRSARRWTVRDLPARLTAGDPWADLQRHAHAVRTARTRLARLRH